MDPTIAHLLELVTCHSTPGDETEVRELLLKTWRELGIRPREHGQYAISANLRPARPSDPVILVCAHMDSPGFIVESIRGDTLSLVPLGGIRFPGEAVRGRLRGAGDLDLPLMVEKLAGDGGRPTYSARCDNPAVRCGDRVCYAASPSLLDNGQLTSPFLDNRVGCAILTALARDASDFLGLPANVVIAATACEEMGGYGAPVLAAAIRPDLVICLDCTYVAPEQQVYRGRGPVLTISDASVLMSRRLRDVILEIMAGHQIPMQTEVYNFSGTDSKAFPHQGLPCPVLPILVPTIGNHGPAEEADCNDVLQTVAAVKALIHDAPGSRLLPTELPDATPLIP